MSVDLLPTEGDKFDEYGYQIHYQGDILSFLKANPKWDLLIAHPPCTYLANSGAKHLYQGMKKENGVNPTRWTQMELAGVFFKTLLEQPIASIAVENPIMLSYGQTIVGSKPNQIIQPWQFGHGETKATCLWLRNLPPLVPTNIVDERVGRIHMMGESKARQKERSRTFLGIAEAMAEQWSQSR